MIKVRAIQMGFLGNVRRKVGAEFLVTEEQFSDKWMVKIGEQSGPVKDKKKTEAVSVSGTPSEELVEMLTGTVANVMDYLNMMDLSEEDLVQLKGFEEKGSSRKGVLDQLSARLDEMRVPVEE